MRATTQLDKRRLGVELLEQGKSTQAVAETRGVSIRTVKRWRKRASPDRLPVTEWRGLTRLNSGQIDRLRAIVENDDPSAWLEDRTHWSRWAVCELICDLYPESAEACLQMPSLVLWLKRNKVPFEMKAKY